MDFALDEEFSTILYSPLESFAFSGSVILNVARSAQQQIGGAYVMIMRRPAGESGQRLCAGPRGTGYDLNITLNDY